MEKILGISAYYHDSAAVLLQEGHITAAAQEERFSRKKHDAGFPSGAVAYCLEQAGLELAHVDAVVFYDKPLVKFERLLETYLAYVPRGLQSFLAAMPVWLKEKLLLKATLKNELSALSGLCKKDLPALLFCDHHRSHAASAFYPSPFRDAAILCLDGVGEWATTSAWHGTGNTLSPQWEIDFPHSLGLLYSAFTFYTGFKVNSGEYKLMGLAPYGKPRYETLIRDNLMDIKPDGTFRLNMDYFNYATGLTMTSHAFDKLFDGPPRRPESEVTQREMDIAASIQAVTEDVVMRLAGTMRKELSVPALCLAGGVALNCVANGKLLRSKIFDDIWIQPAAGDAGGALGAALSVWHEYQRMERKAEVPDSMQGAYLGPAFSNSAIKGFLKGVGAPFRELDDERLLPETARLLQQEKVIGWFQGRMEFGPRALGARSIIGDARSPGMQSVMNLKIKYRESFRPFAPVVKYDKVQEWFDLHTPSPYMLIVAEVQEDKRVKAADTGQEFFGMDKLKVVRSEIPAVTHVDYSARVQTVHPETNPRFYRLLDEFDALTGCPVLVNTSFNVRGEPIVCSPEDAYRCFMRTEMDYLVMENIILSKEEQPAWNEDKDWRDEFELD